MTAKGIVKSLEEIGELQKELGALSQVLAKKLAYYRTDEHPDGAGSLASRIENEMGDVIGSIQFVAMKNDLSWEAIMTRANKKEVLFKRWDADPDNNALAIDGAAQ